MVKAFLVFEDLELEDIVVVDFSLLKKDFFVNLTLTGYVFAKVIVGDENKAKSLFQKNYSEIKMSKLKNSEIYVIREFSNNISTEKFIVE